MAAPAASSSGVISTADVQSLPSSAKQQLLRDLMQRPARHPSQVLICATHVLAHGGAASEAERWAFTEMAAIAAIDLGRDAQATELIRTLRARFGQESTRVRRLIGMQLEAAGSVESAMQLYQAVLKDHPTEQWCVRRLSAIHRSRGDYKLAIEALRQREVYIDPKEKNKTFTYAQLYPTDEAAARELISLHWLLNNVSQCIRFADEVVLFDPANYSHHTRLAELTYADGQYERSANAYAQSLRLNDGRNNARAFYGLWLVASQLVKAKNAKKASGELADASQLLEFAATKLRGLYAGSKTVSYLDLTLKA
uniref:ER membrane protein complex subunit 2 n=1 Tax=Neobodo designis TaxID=312471 RepID=A0A7S1WAR8_NEODS|mmetsp:Transcript_93/g.328  ORF Transcript_93/g.328 Transcript_93/m.328 type:complete len:311 (+) Transcript_93:38-970(+)|eukprot:CAMPEP_0174855578 /NCGR_PEP_ID=MMETSP1114-20130205/33606_1 /TAXON_ID=312471 /ORGANISM="Neobodo designis, Strain CCAP 1951/1" /LENGTH=310 /DNA_ID=CAMNT_0016090319 /DNA_START=37 /DNA_END=969 /DNA_ORIENTATION=-